MAFIAPQGVALACDASEGYASDAKGLILPGDENFNMVEAAREYASAICDRDNSRLRFAAKITVHLYTSRGYADVKVTSLRLNQWLRDPEQLRSISSIYVGLFARSLGFPVHIAFFHAGDDDGKAKSTFTLTVEDGELRVAGPYRPL